ncbi:uncharacterized protein LOC111369486 [Olea europaea var. sylvestris]|uniref:uncharacterized protein LOC111369486 n=1 Tax=Olea europaea var. sylvestris TaxID=158386 RepID=UPI000C1D8038|nr:uncharacterized protein LOC111369486 [Olea europaea var. sylvestris]
MSSQMPEKASKFSWILRSNPLVHWWFKVLVMLVFLGIFVVWTIDGLNVNTFQKSFVVLKFNSSGNLSRTHDDLSFKNLSVEPRLVKPYQENQNNQSLVQTHENFGPKIAPAPVNLDKNQQNSTSEDEGLNSRPSETRILDWITSELEANYSSKLLGNWLAPGGEPCRDSKTVDISIPGLDGHDKIELLTGNIHEFVFQALDDSGKPHCLGGDYFETDISGESWKTRPPIKDFGNGTYRFSLQVHPDFTGDFNLTIILLFRHYEGLKFSPERFAFDRVLRVIPIKFLKSSAKLPEMMQCKKSDYNRDVWSGRWTRHARNDKCQISNDGRYRCLNPNFPCQHPWCNGPLGVLESNGWIYSTHCSFKMFSSEEAWNCLSNHWIFWWGDSNHCDTIRNILRFILDVHDIEAVPRRFDMNITNPKNPSQMVRFTSIFNGNPNATGNYQGLNSLINAEYRELLKGYFSGNAVPNSVIMNSGLHDGVFWPNIRRFIKGADYAASFWAEIVNGVRKRGLKPPEIIYRTTVTTGGYARRLAFNPHKMEAFNGVVLEKLRQYGVLDRVIDDFDMTYPWHYDNRCNDGVHYGRAPAKLKWRDGQIGHQYFVDLMLGHVLLNALCVR